MGATDPFERTCVGLRYLRYLLHSVRHAIEQEFCSGSGRDSAQRDALLGFLSAVLFAVFS